MSPRPERRNASSLGGWQRHLTPAPLVFPWHYHRRTLWVEFHRIQTEAGIKLDCPQMGEEGHECGDGCRFYGFHDIRRAFATANVGTLSGDALQTLMRHKDYSTTKRYINMARELTRSVADLHVPEVLRKKA